MLFDKASAKWSYDDVDSERMRKAYDLLFARRSWQDIAERIGGGFTANGVRYSSKNPIWMGVRRFTAGGARPSISE